MRRGFQSTLSQQAKVELKKRISERFSLFFGEYSLLWCSLLSTFITLITILFCTGIRFIKIKYR